jgi:SAM-dependent methyltransferase
MSKYVIEGGHHGKERLKLLSKVLLPTTSQLLKNAGLAEGMKCLDVGCGGGFVTALMSDMVGPSGQVVGIDADEEILNLARADAESTGTLNVEYCKFDASQRHREDYYDLVYARFLLTHVPAPQSCLESMISSSKRSGMVVVEDIDFTGNFSYPKCHAYQRYTELYQKVVKLRGGDANIGPKLPGMFRTAGLRNVRVNLIQPVHFEGEGKLLAAITMQRIASSVIAEKLATEAEIDEVIAGLNAAAEDKDVLLSAPRIFQVWGNQYS